jgi:hypothetical protein
LALLTPSSTSSTFISPSLNSYLTVYSCSCHSAKKNLNLQLTFLPPPHNGQFTKKPRSLHMCVITQYFLNNW